MSNDKTGLWLAIILLGLTVVVLGGFILFGGGLRGGYGYMMGGGQPAAPGGPGRSVICTMEAKQCPDGSYVGRQGPNCEFAACPSGTKVQINY